MIFPDIDADNNYPLILPLLILGLKSGHFLHAGTAPGAPEIQHDRLPLVLVQRMGKAVKPQQFKGRGFTAFMRFSVSAEHRSADCIASKQKYQKQNYDLNRLSRFAHTRSPLL
ncbi:hypothetical protein D3C80_1555390 [compost metagenome]